MTAPEYTISPKKISLLCFYKADSLKLKIMFTIGISKTEKLDSKCIECGCKEGSKSLAPNFSSMKWRKLKRSKSNYFKKSSPSSNIRLMKKRSKWRKPTKSTKKKSFNKRERIGKRKKMKRLIISMQKRKKKKSLIRLILKESRIHWRPLIRNNDIVHIFCSKEIPWKHF